MSAERLAQYKSSLPSGAFWIKGEDLAELVDILIEDRARLMPSSGNELPSSMGRWFNTGAANGSGAPLGMLQLVDASTFNSDGSLDVAQVRVVAGNIGDDVPDGFSPGDSPPYLMAVSGTGKIWAVITQDTGSGAITDVSLDSGSSPPDDDSADGLWYYVFGSYKVVDSGANQGVTCSNSAFGPITLVVCRVPFAAPPEYTVTVVGMAISTKLLGGSSSSSSSGSSGESGS